MSDFIIYDSISSVDSDSCTETVSFSTNSVPIIISDNSPANLNSPFLFKAVVLYGYHNIYKNINYNTFISRYRVIGYLLWILFIR